MPTIKSISYKKIIRSRIKSIVNHTLYQFVILLILLPLSLKAKNNTDSLNFSPYKIETSKESQIFGFGGLSLLSTKLLYQFAPEKKYFDFSTKQGQLFAAVDRELSIKNYSRTYDKIGDILVVSLVAYPAVYLIDDKLRDNFITIAIMYSETMFIAGFIADWGKSLVYRPRPFTYSVTPDNIPLPLSQSPDRFKSFFSGHTSIAFASMVFLSTVYNDYYPNSEYTTLVTTSSLTLASLVGISRVKAGKHFPTDVALGAVVGSVIGYLIPEFHKSTDGKIKLSVTPNQANLFIEF